MDGRVGLDFLLSGDERLQKIINLKVNKLYVMLQRISNLIVDQWILLMNIISKGNIYINCKLLVSFEIQNSAAALRENAVTSRCLRMYAQDTKKQLSDWSRVSSRLHFFFSSMPFKICDHVLCLKVFAKGKPWNLRLSLMLPIEKVNGSAASTMGHTWNHFKMNPSFAHVGQSIRTSTQMVWEMF